ncbi:MAG: DUF1549 and DUF1553 domain-containing protein [Planctomycetota bacterium]
MNPGAIPKILLVIVSGLLTLLDRAHAQEKNDEPNEKHEYREPELTDVDRQHWSLRTVERPALPSVANKDLLGTAIDSFILSKLQEKGLVYQPPADRGTLLRRLKFDLHGLPPSVEELERFEQDEQPDAVERLVDRLLGSPQYGQRWAQHWLDLARYAETDGFEHDKTRAGVWRYRDWVIAALNKDMPYDDFVRHQLCADQVRGADPIATQFCLAGSDMPDINEQDLRRHDKLNEITSTVGATLLGLQFHCAQCHDHKFDAISQADFYRLRAVFESAIPVMVRNEHILTLEQQKKPLAAKFYRRGELSGVGSTVLPALPRLAVQQNEIQYLTESSARMQFADWLFHRDNPLTARILANRIWQQHFGKSLLENPSDVGVLNIKPEHRELLEWLACELMSADWSIKHLHRQILLSNCYRQASGIRPENGDELLNTKDPDNSFYGRFPMRRLSGEEVRDALLATSGIINLRMGGPSAHPPLPPELKITLLEKQWKESQDRAEHYRRSIFVFARRNLRYPIFEAFDRPDAGASCAIRNESTTAIQSLHLLNSDLTLDCAKRLASSVRQNLPAERSKESIDAMVKRVFGRSASHEEITFLHQALEAAESSSAGYVAIAVALYNSNEFLYVD